MLFKYAFVTTDAQKFVNHKFFAPKNRTMKLNDLSIKFREILFRVLISFKQYNCNLYGESQSMEDSVYFGFKPMSL